MLLLLGITPLLTWYLNLYFVFYSFTRLTEDQQYVRLQGVMYFTSLRFGFGFSFRFSGLSLGSSSSSSSSWGQSLERPQFRLIHVGSDGLVRGRGFIVIAVFSVLLHRLANLYYHLRLTIAAVVRWVSFFSSKYAMSIRNLYTMFNRILVNSRLIKSFI